MGLRPASEVNPLMLITDPEPLLKGTIGTVASTFGLTDNAIRDPGQILAIPTGSSTSGSPSANPVPARGGPSFPRHRFHIAGKPRLALTPTS